MLYNVILFVPIVLLFCVLLYKCLLDFGLSPKSAKHAVLPEEDFDCRAAYPNEWKTFGFALGVRILVMVAALFCIMIGSNEQVSLWDCLAKLRLWQHSHLMIKKSQGVRLSKAGLPNQIILYLFGGNLKLGKLKRFL